MGAQELHGPSKFLKICGRLLLSASASVQVATTITVNAAGRDHDKVLICTIIALLLDILSLIAFSAHH
jgi:hypothetical protein